MYLIEPFRNGEYIDDGAYALAMQVYVNENVFLDEGIIFPYYCQPKIEIGRFQNARQEVNQEYLDENGIIVVRRDTGGGAVLVDEGAVNVCFLIPNDELYGNFKMMYEPVIQALKNLGVKNVEQSGRNDLLIDGKKVSGAAMTKANGRVYGGFSLLLDIHPERMLESLNPNQKKIESKGIKSVRSRVTTIREHLKPELQNITTDEFKDLMIKELLNISSVNDAKRYELTDEDWKNIDKLVEDKYKNWDWNYGNAPNYSYKRDGRTAAGTIEIHLEIEDGRIEKCQIYGDFFGQGQIDDVSKHLIGTRVKREDLIERLSEIDLNYYIGNIEAEDLVEIILS